MPALVVVPANVKIIDDTAKFSRVVAGEAVTQGEVGYLKSDEKYWLADSNVTAVEAAALGIFLTPGLADEEPLLVTSGNIVLGVTLAKGERYFVGDVAGEIVPSGDISTGEYVTYLGIATSTTVLKLNIDASGITLA